MIKLWLIIFDISSQVSNGFAIVSAPNPNTAQQTLMIQGSGNQKGYNITGIQEVGTSCFHQIRILTEGITSRGEQGAKGEKGDKGEQGLKGEPFTYKDFTPEQLEALRGPEGKEGKQGVQGPKGDKGEQGIQGIKGDTGQQGPIGPQGPVGNPFVYEDFTKEQLEALRGPQGIQGEKGDKGNDGYTPQKGIDYFDGEQGPQGEIGPTGPQGEKGEKGDQGERGLQGEQGIQGIQGPKGDTYSITQDDYIAIAQIVKEEITIPTKTSELTNDSGFITNSYHDNTKQNTISDLDTIRSGAALGATSVQPQSISNMLDQSLSLLNKEGEIVINNLVVSLVAEEFKKLNLNWEINNNGHLILST